MMMLIEIEIDVDVDVIRAIALARSHQHQHHHHHHHQQGLILILHSNLLHPHIVSNSIPPKPNHDPIIGDRPWFEVASCNRPQRNSTQLNIQSLAIDRSWATSWP